jgi:hypothetical protein
MPVTRQMTPKEYDKMVHIAEGIWFFVKQIKERIRNGSAGAIRKVVREARRQGTRLGVYNGTIRNITYGAGKPKKISCYFKPDGTPSSMVEVVKGESLLYTFKEGFLQSTVTEWV